MELAEPFVCRLCLSICIDFEIIEDATKSILNFILLILDLNISDDPVMCSGCKENLKKCFEFKAACLRKRDLIFDMHEDVKLPPSVTCLKENSDLEVKNFDSGAVCCICIENIDPSTSLKNEEELLMSALEVYLPELDLKFKDSLVCTPCRHSLQGQMKFVDNCLSTEKKIKEYCEVKGTNSKDQVELKHVLHFGSENKVRLDTNSISIILVKSEEKCEQVDDKSVVKLENRKFVKVEGTPLPCTENDALTKVEPADEERFNRNTHCPTQSESTPVEMDEEIVYKCKKCPYYTGFNSLLEKHKLSHNRSAAVVKIYKCETCGYQHKLRKHLLRHAKLHKTPSATYKCEHCSYLASKKHVLTSHMRTHGTLTQKSTSEVKLYKCDICSFHSKRKHSFLTHILCHQNYSATYKCEQCPFATLNKDKLSAHMHAHKTYFEADAIKLEIRTYQSKHKRELAEHDSVAYECEDCVFATSDKEKLSQHMHAHETSFEAAAKKSEMLKCQHCQRKRKRELAGRDSAMYKCEECVFATSNRERLSQHMHAHKTLFEAGTKKLKLRTCQRKSEREIARCDPTTYKCEQCPFGTLYKESLSAHMLTHDTYFESGAKKLEIRTYQPKHKRELAGHDESKNNCSSNNVQA